jgi:hypothetical protein
LEEAAGRYSELVDYGRYAMQLESWFEEFGQNRILPVFFDSLRNNPQVELNRICKFIGYSGKPTWADDLGRGNVSSQRVRRFPFYDLLVESAPATWLRRRFIPQSLRDAVKSQLKMRKRPELAPATRDRLTDVFDRDLSRLGTWLGVDLNCSNFKEVTEMQPLEWTNWK